MKETVSHLQPVKVREDARAADARRVRQNGYRNRGQNHNQEAPEAPAFEKSEATMSVVLINTVSVVRLRATEISEDHSQRDQRHQRAYAATGFHDLQLLGLLRAQRQKLYDVPLP